MLWLAVLGWCGLFLGMDLAIVVQARELADEESC